MHRHAPSPADDGARRGAPARGSAAGLLAARGGSVATTFALASVPLLFMSGAAIDYGLATRQQAKLQAAADATALNLCQTPLATTTPQLQTRAGTLMVGYLSDASLAVDPLRVVPATQTSARTITLTAHVTSTAFFGGITGVRRPLETGTSQCSTPVPKTFEIALVLDNTGSMAESSGSQSKLQAVQQAASDFVDYVKTKDAFSKASRISVVPFAATVAVDPSSSRDASWVDSRGLSAYHWTNVERSPSFASRLAIFDALARVRSEWGWAGCFETQPYPEDVEDGAPSAANTQEGWNTLYVPSFAPDEPGDGTRGTATWRANWFPAASSSWNSYIDDTGSCGGDAPDFATAEKRACKYDRPRGAAPTSSNPNGLPNGPNFQCIGRPLQRLTGDAPTLKALIRGMVAQGSTNIHEGMIWGWRTLSPLSVFADGAAYPSRTAPDPNGTTKVLILMTDGENSWSPSNGASPNGSAYFAQGYLRNADGSTPAPHLPAAYQLVTTPSRQRAALDALTAETCTNAKAAGVSIYTIGFSVPSDPIDGQGLQLLQACASEADQAFVANDSASLIAAFNRIAASIGALRISR